MEDAPKNVQDAMPEPEPIGKPTRGFLNKTAWYTGTYVLRTVVSVLLMSITTRILKVSSFGVYSQVAAVGAILQQVVQFGMPRLLGMWLLQHPTGAVRATAFWSALWTSWIIGGCMLTFAVPLLSANYKWLDPTIAGTLLMLVTLGEVGRATLITVQALLDWDEDVRARLRQDLASVMLPAGLVILLLTGTSLGVVGYAAGQNLGLLLVAIWQLAYVVRRYDPVLDWSRIRIAMTSGTVFFLSHLCWAFIGSADRLLLAAVGSGARASGLYQTALAVASTIGGGGSALAQMVARHVFDDASTHISRLARPVVLSLLFPPLFALLAAATTPILLRVLTPASYWPSYAYVPVIVAALGLAVCSNLGVGTLLQQKRYKLCLAYEFSAAVVNVACNRALIPTMDIWGCAVSMLVTYLWLACLIWCREGMLSLDGAWPTLARTGTLWIVCGAAIGWLTATASPQRCVWAFLEGMPLFMLLTTLTLWQTGDLPALKTAAAAAWQKLLRVFRIGPGSAAE